MRAVVPAARVSQAEKFVARASFTNACFFFCARALNKPRPHTRSFFCLLDLLLDAVYLYEPQIAIEVGFLFFRTERTDLGWAPLREGGRTPRRRHLVDPH